jgi:hypothetical protein
MDPENPLKEIDPLAGNSMAMPAQTPMGPMGQQPQGGGLGLESVGTPVRPDGSSMQTPEQFDALMREPPPPFEGADGQLYTTDINDPDNPIKPYDPNALQVVGREGALPPDVQAQQLGALGQAQQATLAANEQARADTARIQQEAFAQEMGVNEARKQAIQQEQQEQTAKVQRWETERQQWAEMEVDKSLSGAQGTFGAALSVLGAALLSSTGSDVGLRMIENSINRHVQGQMQRRDSMLRIYAERIGDPQQAIKMAKSEMYKITADRAELMTKKTANDVYEAQSPAIISGLREKHVAEMNEAQRIGMGKTIEKLPERAKPVEPAALQKYGELRRERDAASDVVGRMEQQVGLEWIPGKNGQPGHYRNKAEVIKNGIQGIGAVEQWIPDFAYSTFGQKEGYQVRGAKQALAYAAVRQMQPTGIITDVDRKVGEMSATMDTEEGLIQTLERIRNGEEQQRRNDEAQYTPQVVGAYEQQYRASGGQQMGELGAGRPAALEDKKREIQRIKQGGQPPAQPGASAAPATSGQERMAQVSEELQARAGAELPPEGLAILAAQAAHETGNGDHMPNNNAFGHKSSGRSRAAGRGSDDLMTTEGAGSGAKRVRQSFATYQNPGESVADHVDLLKRKYPDAWAALEAGDAAAYVAALKDGGYFTGDETAYLKSIQRRL